MIVFTPPACPSGHVTNTLFLAGSIEVGKADDWQKVVIAGLEAIPGMVMNPRRPDWDNSWGEDSPQLKEQINWEIDQLECVDTIFFYFQAGTLSPISMMELGLIVGQASVLATFGDTPQRIFVVCESGFWRRTNITVLCKREGIQLFDNLTVGFDALRTHLSDNF
jgi:hypothetical protein